VLSKSRKNSAACVWQCYTCHTYRLQIGSGRSNSEQASLAVRALVCGLPAGKWERRQFFVLRGYIDDSGNRQHSPVLVLAGFIAPVVTWLAFTPDWQAMLDMPPRLDYFKMNEAATLTGQFKYWSQQRADERIALAYRAIEQHIPFQVSCIVHLEPFYRIFNPSNTEESAINPFYLAFSSIIHDVAQNQLTHGVDEKIDFVFDDQAMEKDKIVKAWDQFKEHINPAVKHLVGSVPAFLDDKDFLPLQAADLLAWWVRKMVEGIAPSPPWRSPLREIPGFQMNYNEERMLQVRDNIIRSLQP
jgi:hypothetical protein